MRLLLVSTYELGHQPIHLASPAGSLRRAGHDVRCLDVSVQPWDAATVDVGASSSMNWLAAIATEHSSTTQVRHRRPIHHQI
jgi:hypothetical protein